MILLGYFLPTLIDPVFKRWFGDQFEIRNHIEKVIVVVVLLSISPGLIAWWRTRKKGPNHKSPEIREKSKPMEIKAF